MDRKVKKLKDKWDTLTEEQQWQLNLHLYLQSVIVDNDWSLEQLSNALGIAYSTTARLKNPTSPTPPVTGLAELKKIAALRNLSTDCMVSIIMGNANEEGEKAGVFGRQIADEINALPNLTQVRISSIIKQPELKHIAETLLAIVKSGIYKKRLVKYITENMGEEECKTLHKFLKIHKEAEE